MKRTNRFVKLFVKCEHCGQEFNPTRDSKKKFCSKKCFNEWRMNDITKSIVDRFERGEHNTFGTRALKKALIKKYGNKCECCNNETRLGKDIPLDLHHKDGNCANTIPGNVELLCPNCHTFTETYKSKNKNSARKR